MTEQPESGELLVGSYLRLIQSCELVMYNQRSQKQGDQLEYTSFLHVHIGEAAVDSTSEYVRSRLVPSASSKLY